MSGRKRIVENLAIKHAIENISCRSGNNYGSGNEKTGAQAYAAQSLPDEPHEEDHGGYTSESEQIFAEKLHSESHTIVFDKAYLKPRKDLIGLTKIEMGLDIELRHLIYNDNQEYQASHQPAYITVRPAGDGIIVDVGHISALRWHKLSCRRYQVL